MGNVLGGYGTAVGQVAGLGDIYNTGVQQQLNRADYARGGAGLYGAGMGLLQQDIANRLGGVNFGYGANMDMNNLGMQRLNLINQALGGYGNASAANSIAQGNIAGNMIGQGLGAIGGMMGNFGGAGGLGGLFGGASGGASGGWGGAFGGGGYGSMGHTGGYTKPYMPGK